MLHIRQDHRLFQLKSLNTRGRKTISIRNNPFYERQLEIAIHARYNRSFWKECNDVYFPSSFPVLCRRTSDREVPPSGLRNFLPHHDQVLSLFSFKFLINSYLAETLRAPIAIPLGTELPISTEQGPRWAPEVVWTLQSRTKSFAAARSRSPDVQRQSVAGGKLRLGSRTGETQGQLLWFGWWEGLRRAGHVAEHTEQP
jgi:hypothetical protein